MKNIYLLFFILILGTSLSFSPKRMESRKYKLTGKIVSDISLPPGCGYIAYATVIEFEIIDSNIKNYIDKTIPIIVKCPEFYGDHFFEKDKIYTLNIINKINIIYANQTDFGWTIPNISIQNKYNLDKKLWAVSIKKEE
ncbi:MAG: hypothetical protein MUW56_03545 [Chryseobacterium sp.]|uniref:hypothetical protein n=1 Tax=Chryseobacterium sp. TaxID=1871047 RepID=UPI0025C63DF4|nr:hypothetical protein [Chryseobacterium sp.]MCJ7932719.1 hypothetical protein [Chryseobacterium sp.]